jgi:hypothetical protein
MGMIAPIPQNIRDLHTVFNLYRAGQIDECHPAIKAGWPMVIDAIEAGDMSLVQWPNPWGTATSLEIMIITGEIETPQEKMTRRPWVPFLSIVR